MTKIKTTPDWMVEDLLERLETVRNWLNEAPIEEIEAVEAAIQQNAPLMEIDEAIELVWKIHGKPITESRLSASGKGA